MPRGAMSECRVRGKHGGAGSRADASGQLALKRAVPVSFPGYTGHCLVLCCAGLIHTRGSAVVLSCTQDLPVSTSATTSQSGRSQVGTSKTHHCTAGMSRHVVHAFFESISCWNKVMGMHARLSWSLGHRKCRNQLGFLPSYLLLRPPSKLTKRPPFGMPRSRDRG